jgi:hypothetical protein
MMLTPRLLEQIYAEGLVSLVILALAAVFFAPPFVRISGAQQYEKINGDQLFSTPSFTPYSRQR